MTHSDDGEQDENLKQRVKKLIDLGADVNAQNNEGRTAIQYAVHSKKAELLVKLLTEFGANTNMHHASHSTTEDVIESKLHILGTNKPHGGIPGR